MERSPTIDEERLLLELARIGGIDDPERWLATLKVREMKDGGMGSLELSGVAKDSARSGVVISKASVQFADEDGVQVVATLNVSGSGVPFELDVWKTDFSPLRRIPTAFQRIDEPSRSVERTENSNEVMAEMKQNGDAVRRLTSEELAVLIIDAMVEAGIVQKAQMPRAIEIAAEEIEVRKVAGDD
jgi:hypothetical protein